MIVKFSTVQFQYNVLISVFSFSYQLLFFPCSSFLCRFQLPKSISAPIRFYLSGNSVKLSFQQIYLVSCKKKTNLSCILGGLIIIWMFLLILKIKLGFDHIWLKCVWLNFSSILQFNTKLFLHESHGFWII